MAMVTHIHNSISFGAQIWQVHMFNYKLALCKVHIFHLVQSTGLGGGGVKLCADQWR